MRSIILGVAKQRTDGNPDARVERTRSSTSPKTFCYCLVVTFLRMFRSFSLVCSVTGVEVPVLL